MSAAPDLVEPVVGWRVWDVVDLDGELRLCSLSFWTIWLPGRETVAVCRRALVDVERAGLPPHVAPAAGCTCGVYATRTAAQALAYARGFRLRGDALHRVVGRTRLWGDVVEAEGGWRGERAYPAALFVATAGGGGPRPGLLPRPRRPAEQIALGLASYGVPVELLDARSQRDLVRLLEPPAPA